MLDPEETSSSLGSKYAGVAIVAVAATFSFLACLLLFSFLIIGRLISWWKRKRKDDDEDDKKIRRGDDNDDGTMNRHTVAGKKFLKTQFGILFLNLAFSDFIQSIGFGSNYYWLGSGSIGDSRPTCVFQAVAIQMGDTASALFTLAIAMQTMSVLAYRKKPPALVLTIGIPCIWLFVILLAILGPAVIEDPKRGYFYSQAGGWCWIAREYDLERFWLHYLFIFIVALVNPVFYVTVFLSLRSRGPMSFRTTLSSSSSLIPRSQPVKHMTKPSISERGTTSIMEQAAEEEGTVVATTERNHNHNPRLQSHLLDQTAKKMLIYPVCYLVLCVPLSVYRLAGIAGVRFPFTFQAASGAIFTLSGAANIILCLVTRKIFFFPDKSSLSIHNKLGKEVATHGQMVESPTLSQATVAFSQSTNHHRPTIAPESLPRSSFSRRNSFSIGLPPHSPLSPVIINVDFGNESMRSNSQGSSFTSSQPTTPIRKVSFPTNIVHPSFK